MIWWELEDRWHDLLHARWSWRIREAAVNFFSFFALSIVYVCAIFGFMALMPLMSPIQILFGACLTISALATILLSLGG